MKLYVLIARSQIHILEVKLSATEQGRIVTGHFVQIYLRSEFRSMNWQCQWCQNSLHQNLDQIQTVTKRPRSDCKKIVSFAIIELSTMHSLHFIILQSRNLSKNRFVDVSLMLARTVPSLRPRSVTSSHDHTLFTASASGRSQFSAIKSTFTHYEDY